MRTGREVQFIRQGHEGTPRDYRARASGTDRARRMEIASEFGREYWDGDRGFGYGGYHYDGRWRTIARRMADFYGLGPDARILDIGCGKGYLLHDFRELLPRGSVAGIDISSYAIENAMEDVKPFLHLASAEKLPFPDRSFDLVVSNMTLHNLELPELKKALSEIERVSSGHAWVSVESWRNSKEKANLLDWQLTCRAFHSPREWLWLFSESGYTGDYEFGYFT